MIRTPLRYPGGKSRAIKQIKEHIPNGFTHYREPFVGGGSMFIYIRQTYPDVKVWINDLNVGVYSLWKTLQDHPDRLLKSIRTIKDTMTNGKELFNYYSNLDAGQTFPPLSTYDLGLRFYILNRISFSGAVDCGGYSKTSFEGAHFNHSCIDKLAKVAPLLDGVLITNLDYSEVIEGDDTDAFYYLDPPYLTATKHKLYGKNGNLHEGFTHEKLSHKLRETNHKFLMTYDDCQEIRDYYDGFDIIPWDLSYCMRSKRKGKEIFVKNY